jgi:hypothetical protein
MFDIQRAKKACYRCYASGQVEEEQSMPCYNCNPLQKQCCYSCYNRRRVVRKVFRLCPCCVGSRYI